MRQSFIVNCAIAFAVISIIVVAENLALAAYLPRVPRLATDFSPAFLKLKLESLAGSPPKVVFFGDSVLWGYALAPQQNAVAILGSRGCPCVNLSFKAGGPVNDYALARLFASFHLRPKLVVLEINQRAFNPADASYGTLHPAISALSAPVLTAGDRAALGAPASSSGPIGRLDVLLSDAWLTYATRADVRALILGDTDAVSPRSPTADEFLGTYDLTPLSKSNVGVRYLERAIDSFNAERIPLAAFLTPTNHTLLHEYIDVPAYESNSRFLGRLLSSKGVRVIDLDRAFPAFEFIDNAHLTPHGQVRLASELGHRIAQLDATRPTPHSSSR